MAGSSADFRARSRRLTVACGALLAACSVGDGTGDVHGTVLLDECFAEGPYVLAPSAFFAQATEELLRLRIQRGSDLELTSDGLAILVRDSSELQKNLLGQELELARVPPPGAASDAGTPLVDVTAYFNESCPPGRTKTPTALQAVSGTIRFDAIYAPQVDEDAVRIRGVMTGAHFTREGDDRSYADLDGEFEFLYVRGRPAQRFP